MADLQTETIYSTEAIGFGFAVSGDELEVTVLFSDGHSHRHFDPADAGLWIYEIRRRVENDSMRCEIRVEDGIAVAIASPGMNPTDWFDLRDPKAMAAVDSSKQLADEALTFINRYRAKHAQQPLDPDKAGWCDDDLLKEAERLKRSGWTG
jgi:hypothetical protein